MVTSSATAGARIRGMFTIMRPSAWVWFDALPALATLSVLKPVQIDLRTIVGLLCGLITTDAAGCVLNDIYDIEVDSRSVEEFRKYRPLVTGAVSLRAAWLQFSFLACLSVALVVWLIPAALPGFIWCWIFVVAYSAPPLRLVGRPWACLPVFPLVGLGTYGCVALLVHKLFTPASIVYALAVALMMGTSGVLAKDIRDWDNDSAGNRTTLVVRIGIPISMKIALVAAAASTVAFLGLFLSGVLACPWWASISGTACVLGWLLLTAFDGRRLLAGYDKKVAWTFYGRYLGTYSLLNCIVIAGSH